jgi:phospholipid/cholesterol/gamma-HCH transport system permease protein
MTTDEKPTSKFIDVKREQEKAYVVLEGEWTVRNAALIERAIKAAKQELGDQAFEVKGAEIEKLDTSGAILLKRLLPGKKAPDDLAEKQRALLDFLPEFSEYKPPKKHEKPAAERFFIAVGKNTFIARDFLWEIIVFIGQAFFRLVRNFARPHHFRLPSIARHMQETGINALSIVSLLAVMISMVITYQGALQLETLGAEIYTVDLTVIALLREMAVLVTAIMVAGRSGSAFAAEIGVMKIRDEVSALRTMGLDPVEVLVLPRILALVVTLPILTLVADVVGLAGTALMAKSLLNLSVEQYLTRVQSVATATTFLVGMIKAPVFAILIAIIGCYQGLNVSGSAESIGRRTTLAVVQSIFTVITADAFFSVVFSHWDI